PFSCQILRSKNRAGVKALLACNHGVLAASARGPRKPVNQPAAAAFLPATIRFPTPTTEAHHRAATKAIPTEDGMRISAEPRTKSSPLTLLRMASISAKSAD